MEESAGDGGVGLPLELWHHIFFLLEPRDLVRIARVSRVLRSYTMGDAAFLLLYYRHRFPLMHGYRLQSREASYLWEEMMRYIVLKRHMYRVLDTMLPLVVISRKRKRELRAVYHDIDFREDMESLAIPSIRVLFTNHSTYFHPDLAWEIVQHYNLYVHVPRKEMACRSALPHTLLELVALLHRDDILNNILLHRRHLTLHGAIRAGGHPDSVGPLRDDVFACYLFHPRADLGGFRQLVDTIGVQTLYKKIGNLDCLRDERERLLSEPKYMYPIHIAVARGHVEIVKFLWWMDIALAAKDSARLAFSKCRKYTTYRDPTYRIMCRKPCPSTLVHTAIMEAQPAVLGYLLLDLKIEPTCATLTECAEYVHDHGLGILLWTMRMFSNHKRNPDVLPPGRTWDGIEASMEEISDLLVGRMSPTTSHTQRGVWKAIVDNLMYGYHGQADKILSKMGPCPPRGCCQDAPDMRDFIITISIACGNSHTAGLIRDLLIKHGWTRVPCSICIRAALASTSDSYSRKLEMRTSTVESFFDSLAFFAKQAAPPNSM